MKTVKRLDAATVIEYSDGSSSMTAGTAATQEPGRTTHRHADVSLASDSAGSDHGDRHNTTARGNGQGAAIMATPISIDVAGELDNQWFNDGMPDDGIRIVGHRISGNRSRTFLTVPGRDDAPHYELAYGQYMHTAGPSVEAWLERKQAEHAARMERQDAADLYAWASGR